MTILQKCLIILSNAAKFDIHVYEDIPNKASQRAVILRQWEFAQHGQGQMLAVLILLLIHMMLERWPSMAQPSLWCASKRDGFTVDDTALN